MVNLRSKNVVFIAPEFFGYDLIIEQALSDSGASVYRLVDRPFSGSIYKAITKLIGRIIGKLLDNHYLSKLKQMNVAADYVLVINGQTISRAFLLKLKSKNPNARFILYMWDSLENRPDIVRNFDVYDEKYSFDRKSAKRFGLKFRPLFYGSLNKNETMKGYANKYLMSFIGTAHSDRYAIVSSLRNKFSHRDCFWYLYLQAQWVYWWYRLSNPTFGGAKKNEFMYSPISSSEMRNVFNNSEIIVDIEHTSQTGLTIRTFDIMRSGKKMVTTNKDVVNYDFYKYGNVYLIDRDFPSIPDDFINRKFSPYSEDIIRFYSVYGWVEDVFNLNGLNDHARQVS